MKKIEEFIRAMLGQTKWHSHPNGERFVWRRWRAGVWETREMTSAEHAEHLAHWAIR